MHIAIITAGGAGMFCGSCMHDNTLAKALHDAGHEVTLIPTYTPIRVDESDQSISDVYLGGINVYLDAQWSWWQRLPRAFTRLLDRPAVIRLATRFGVSNNAKQLGKLTVDLLSGELGPQRREIDELVQFISQQLRPDVVIFSNALLVGVLRQLRKSFSGRTFCMLQGDDIFLQDLPDPWKSQSLDLIAERAAEFDGFLVHSRYYRDFMSDFLRLPADRFHQVPLGIDLDGHDGQPVARGNAEFTVGYFARICPEKGLHNLVEAFKRLHDRHPSTRLRAGGFIGPRDLKYLDKIRRSATGLGDAFEFVGSPATRDEKVAFYKSIDVLSVPTDYREPKGLPILEAWANGVPVVQPRHGSFPEMIEATGGGCLFEPGDIAGLADSLESLMLDTERRIKLAEAGHARVRHEYGTEHMARRTIDILSEATGTKHE